MAAYPWFKFYAEFLDDPKVQIMPVAMRYRLVALMCAHCKEETRTDKMCAFRWGITMEEVQETKATFIESGFIDDQWNLLNWSKRQEPSPEAKRQKAWRDKQKRNALRDRYVTVDVDLRLKNEVQRHPPRSDWEEFSPFDEHQ